MCGCRRPSGLAEAKVELAKCPNVCGFAEPESGSRTTSSSQPPAQVPPPEAEGLCRQHRAAQVQCGTAKRIPARVIGDSTCTSLYIWAESKIPQLLESEMPETQFEGMQRELVLVVREFNSGPA